MGMFSYMCQISGKQICAGDKVRLYRLVNGKVREEMRGVYDCYGAVEEQANTYHALYDGSGEKVVLTIQDKSALSCPVNHSGDMWLSDDWSTVVDEHFNTDITTGICAVLEADFIPGYVPTEISEDDPHQGIPIDDKDDEWLDDDDDDLY